MPATPEEVADLASKMEAQGAKVRELKTANAPAEEVKAAVNELLALKKAHAAATGAPPPAESSGKKKKKKKNKDGEKDKEAAAAADAAKAARAAKWKKKKPAEGKEGKEGKAAKAEDAAPSEKFSFPGMEEEINAYWQKIDAFKKSLKFSEGRPEFNFYDGPPFATGQPHYGHLLAGTIKDVVTRFAHQTGHYVERRFGWDTHGLPVEYEIDKKLGIKGPDDVMKMGIDKYNAECRAIVMRYSSDWRTTVSRLGRWIDFDNDYKTLYPWFMESVWWVFKEIYKKDMVYRGFKVMPFSAALGTPLSNFEANQDMQEVQDPSVTVSFPIIGDESTSFLAWTTTPWTLPSNLALCVHPEMTYVKFRDIAKDRVYIAAKGRVTTAGALYKKPSAEVYEILEEFPGATLVGKEYEPLFAYFAARKGTSFRVVADTYVTEDSGTGVVHQAPGHGEDDYRVCAREKIITTEDCPCPVDNSGRYTEEIDDMVGVFYADANKGIIKRVKEAGRLFESSRIKHTVGHCWRSHTPLIRKTISSWFVRVESIKDQLVANNKETSWVPNNIRDGRFHNWLSDARDWAISRNRYWGTPIPLWASEDMEEIVCIGSIEELRELSGREDIIDLHRDSIDDITIPSKEGKGELRRVSEVFDCWFESGSMPYASRHYPFENKERFENCFPADFIAEGVDQTRGWFYTLLILGTTLFGTSPFKNVIVNGMVRAADGKKMSKSLKNYPDPNIVLKEEGADSLRLYLITSPAVRAEDLNFDVKGVRQMVKEVFLPWLNAFRFFEQSCDKIIENTGFAFTFDSSRACTSTNQMDKWILAFTQSLAAWVRDEMSEYRLYTVVPRLVKFVDNLTNWYVRFNRKRLKGQAAGGDAEAKLALWTLGEVLLTMAKMMSPFTPFFAEWVYQHMRTYVAPAHPVGDTKDWATADVCSWLSTSGLGIYEGLFAENGITGEDLVDLTHEDLASMGIGRCTDRKAVLRAARAVTNPELAAAAASIAGAPRTIDGVSEEDSVHFQMLPVPKDFYHNPEIVRAFEFMKRAIEAARIIRDQKKMPTKYPLSRMVIVTTAEHAAEDLTSLSGYIKDELNVQEVVVSADEKAYSVNLKLGPNFQKLGKTLGNDMRAVAAALRSASDEDVATYQSTGSLEVCGRVFSGDDLNVFYEADKKTAKPELAMKADGNMMVILDTTQTPEMQDDGVAREVVNRVQRLRKKSELKATDNVKVNIVVTTDDEETRLGKVLISHAATITEALGGSPVTLEVVPEGAAFTGKDDTKIKSAKATIWVTKC